MIEIIPLVARVMVYIPWAIIRFVQYWVSYLPMILFHRLFAYDFVSSFYSPW